MRLENLENRTVLSVAANDAFVATLYQGVLGRNAETGALVYWTGRLNAGATRADVAFGIETSDEGVGRSVQLFYNDLLGRLADSAGLNYWVEATRRGATLQQVKANILGSDEFFIRAGGNLTAYLNAVGRAELGHGLDANGQSYFSATPNRPGGRAAAAFQIMRSPEAEQVKVNSIYLEILGHPVDSTGSQFWVGALQQGAHDSQVIAGIAGSDEFFARVQSFAAAANDPNTAAHQFIVSAKLFNATLPGAEQLNSTSATDPSLVLPAPPGPQPHLQEVQTPVFGPDYYYDPSGFYLDGPIFYDPYPVVLVDAGPPVFVDPSPPVFVDPTYDPYYDPSYYDNGGGYSGDCGCDYSGDSGF